MKLKVAGCYGGHMPGRHNSGFVLDGETLIDAGTIGMNMDIHEQRKIRRILISHPHLDHIEGLPFYAVNIVSNKAPTVPVIGAKYTIDAIKEHLMNGIIWPDFTGIKNFSGNEVLSYRRIPLDKWFNAGPYRIKAVSVNHTIKTNGYIIGKGGRYIMYSGDTKATSKIWKEAVKLGKKLKTVIVEMSFPNELEGLADASCHFVPRTLENELKKLGKLKPKVLVYHIKPEHLVKVKKEIRRIKSFDIQVLEEKKTYDV
ncbi:MAG: MBL fold metallo-hydrolase [Candidatus Goldiibacteriota bacterium]